MNVGLEHAIGLSQRRHDDASYRPNSGGNACYRARGSESAFSHAYSCRKGTRDAHRNRLTNECERGRQDCVPDFR